MISRAVGSFGSLGGVKIESQVEDWWSYAPRHHSETNAKHCSFESGWLSWLNRDFLLERQEQKNNNDGILDLF